MSNLTINCANYRERQREQDAYRLQVYLPAQYRALVADTAAKLGTTNKDAIQHLLKTGAISMDEPTFEDVIAAAPNDSVRRAIRKAKAEAEVLAKARGDVRGSRLSTSEQASLEKFKVQLAEAHGEARHIQAHGGEKAMAQKERVAESWLHNNPHKNG
jgi:hypothetical protein